MGIEINAAMKRSIITGRMCRYRIVSPLFHNWIADSLSSSWQLEVVNGIPQWVPHAHRRVGMRTRMQPKAIQLMRKYLRNRMSSRVRHEGSHQPPDRFPAGHGFQHTLGNTGEEADLADIEKGVHDSGEEVFHGHWL